MDEAIKLGEGVRPQRGRAVLLGRVVLVEFGGEVREVGKGEFARVGAVAYAEEAELAGDEVARRFMSAEEAKGVRHGALVGE